MRSLSEMTEDICLGWWEEELGSSFPSIRASMNGSYCEDEIKMITSYLSNGLCDFEIGNARTGCLFGCRVKAETHSSGILTSPITDGVFVWRADLAHYVQFHEVKLPDIFYTHICNSKNEKRRIFGIQNNLIFVERRIVGVHNDPISVKQAIFMKSALEKYVIH
jgi:hypothetical protein